MIAGGLGHTLLTLIRLLSVALLPLSLSLLKRQVPAKRQMRGNGAPAACAGHDLQDAGPGARMSPIPFRVARHEEAPRRFSAAAFGADEVATLVGTSDLWG